MNEDHARRLQAASAPRRATLDDSDRLTQLLTAAFLNDPIMDWLARPGPKRAAGLTAFFSRLLRRRAIPAGEVWMSDDGSACAVNSRTAVRIFMVLNGRPSPDLTRNVQHQNSLNLCTFFSKVGPGTADNISTNTHMHRMERGTTWRSFPTGR